MALSEFEAHFLTFTHSLVSLPLGGGATKQPTNSGKKVNEQRSEQQHFQ